MKASLLTIVSIVAVGLGTIHAQTVPTYLLSGEEANAPAEGALFPQLYTVRHVNVRTARTGQAAVRLAAQPLPATLSSTLLPVQAGQQLTLTVYAHAMQARSRRWVAPAAQALAGSLVVGTMPTTRKSASEQPNNPLHLADG